MPASIPEPAAAAWDLKLLYDGDCPLCSREADALAPVFVFDERILRSPRTAGAAR